MKKREVMREVHMPANADRHAVRHAKDHSGCENKIEQDAMEREKTSFATLGRRSNNFNITFSGGPGTPVKTQSPGTTANAAPEEDIHAQLNAVKIKLDERRRRIEEEKRKMEVVMAKQREKVGKEAFLRAVVKGIQKAGNASDAAPTLQDRAQTEILELANKVDEDQARAIEDDRKGRSRPLSLRLSQNDGDGGHREQRQDSTGTPQEALDISRMSDSLYSLQSDVQQLAIQQAQVQSLMSTAMVKPAAESGEVDAASPAGGLGRGASPAGAAAFKSGSPAGGFKTPTSSRQKPFYISQPNDDSDERLNGRGRRSNSQPGVVEPFYISPPPPQTRVMGEFGGGTAGPAAHHRGQQQSQARGHLPQQHHQPYYLQSRPSDNITSWSGGNPAPPPPMTTGESWGGVGAPADNYGSLPGGAQHQMPSAASVYYQQPQQPAANYYHHQQPHLQPSMGQYVGASPPQAASLQHMTPPQPPPATSLQHISPPYLAYHTPPHPGEQRYHPPNQHTAVHARLSHPVASQHQQPLIYDGQQQHGWPQQPQQHPAHRNRQSWLDDNSGLTEPPGGAGVTVSQQRLGSAPQPYHLPASDVGRVSLERPRSSGNLCQDYQPASQSHAASGRYDSPSHSDYNQQVEGSCFPTGRPSLSRHSSFKSPSRYESSSHQNSQDNYGRTSASDLSESYVSRSASPGSRDAVRYHTAGGGQPPVVSKPAVAAEKPSLSATFLEQKRRQLNNSGTGSGSAMEHQVASVVKSQSAPLAAGMEMMDNSGFGGNLQEETPPPDKKSEVVTFAAISSSPKSNVYARLSPVPGETGGHPHRVVGDGSSPHGAASDKSMPIDSGGVSASPPGGEAGAVPAENLPALTGATGLTPATGLNVEPEMTRSTLETFNSMRTETMAGTDTGSKGFVISFDNEPPKAKPPQLSTASSRRSSSKGADSTPPTSSSATATSTPVSAHHTSSNNFTTLATTSNINNSHTVCPTTSSTAVEQDPRSLQEGASNAPGGRLCSLCVGGGVGGDPVDCLEMLSGVSVCQVCRTRLEKAAQASLSSSEASVASSSASMSSCTCASMGRGQSELCQYCLTLKAKETGAWDVIMSQAKSNAGATTSRDEMKPPPPPVFNIPVDDVDGKKPEVEKDLAAEKKKDWVEMMTLKRKQQAEENRIKREEEAALRRETEEQKKEELMRKKEEERKRREEILEHHRIRKEQERAEREGSSTLGGLGGYGGPPSTKMRPRSAGGMKPRPRTIHVDNSEVASEDGTSSLGPSASPGNGGLRGSQSNLYVTGGFRAGGRYGPARRGSNVSLHDETDLYGGTLEGLGHIGRSKSSSASNLGPGSLPLGLRLRNGKDHFDDGSSDVSLSSTTSGYRSGQGSAKLFREPVSKSNRPIIMNAVEYAVFPGAVNSQTRARLLEEIERCDCPHFLIMFRDCKLQFRGLYAYYPDTDEVFKIYGAGPKQVNDNMIECYYKYNSGGKKFTQIHTKHLTMTIDAFTIHNSLWLGKKTKLPEKKDMALII